MCSVGENLKLRLVFFCKGERKLVLFKGIVDEIFMKRCNCIFKNVVYFI